MYKRLSQFVSLGRELASAYRDNPRLKEETLVALFGNDARKGAGGAGRGAGGGMLKKTNSALRVKAQNWSPEQSREQLDRLQRWMKQTLTELPCLDRNPDMMAFLGRRRGSPSLSIVT